MNKTRLSLMAIALFTLLCLPFSALAQTVKLAEWTFETGYETVDVDGKTYYKPNTEAAADIAVTWFKDAAPYIYANEFVGEQTDYIMSAQSKDRYWQVCTGYEVKVLRIENTTANAITDYTDAAQHNVYYEVSFPTKGYNNISIDYAIAPGNNTQTPIRAVVSTDGGVTWFDAGETQTSTAWFIYTKTSFNLSVNNKDKVIVRLIVTDGATNWNLDYLTVNGEKMEEAQPVEAANATVFWEFNAAENNPSAAEVSVPEAVSATSFALGSGLKFAGTQSVTDETLGKEVLSKLNPANTVDGLGNAEDADAYVMFSIVPKKGIKFTPKTLSFNSCKCGTSGGTANIYAVCGDQKITVKKEYNPTRNNLVPPFTASEFDLSALGTVTERVDIYFYVYNLSGNKQLAFNDIKVTGDFNGTPEPVPTYTMSAKCGTEGAGNVSVNPAGAEFDEGTELTVTASENFGYHFSAWVDEDGNTVSTENPYVFEIKENTALTATYTQKNVYALHCNVTGGANDYLIQFSPMGNVVDGIHYYEEGTEVKLSALENTILKFNNWEDNTTFEERTIKMDGEKSVTATYSCDDYIVAWDFYHQNPRNDRAADYKSDSENAGLLVIRKADGTTSSWLAAGTDNGSPYLEGNARPWKDLSEKWYFEISFSTKGWTDIKIEGKMGKDYNSYNIFDVEYSTDGTSYTKFGQVDIPGKMWVKDTLYLPKEAEDQAKIWVRWMPDFDSGISGSESNLDGIKWGPTFVLASINAANDPDAPKLVSSIPADGATGVSANGSIILNFDEKIVAVDGAKATLGDKELTPVVSGKTLIYPYTRLSYETEYTFTLPAGAITDRNGNMFEGAEIKFTTMSRKQPEPRVYDAVVAADGSGDYTTVQAAVDAAPENRGTPWLIFVKEGVYEEHVDIPASKPYLYFVGQNKDKVSISDDQLCGGDNAVHVSIGATVVAKSSNLFFEGISFVNSYGVEANNGPQALALNTMGDRVVFNNCGMYSYQDTWITTSTSNNRCYAKKCFIEGAVDYIYNSGNYFFDECTHNIVRKSGGYIVAPSHTADVKWGYVFMNNTITAPGVPSETEVWLGRPWHNNPKTVWINTIAEVTIPAAGWYDHMGGLPVIWAEYNTMDGKGNPVDLSQRRTKYWKEENGEKVWGEAKAILTAEEAAAYTIQNVLGGDDNWQPELMCEACDKPAPIIVGSVMTWEAVPYSICYVVSKDGKVVGFTTDTTYNVEDGATYTVQAANEFGGLSEAGTATIDTGIESVSNTEAATIGAIYSIDGKRLSKVKSGQVNIIKYTDGSIKKATK